MDNVEQGQIFDDCAFLGELGTAHFVEQEGELGPVQERKEPMLVDQELSRGAGLRTDKSY